MSIEITMPRLSDTMETGTIIKWNVAEGDAVSAGDIVADIETDKATMEMQVYDDGRVAKIIVPEGQTSKDELAEVCDKVDAPIHYNRTGVSPMLTLNELRDLGVAMVSNATGGLRINAQSMWDYMHRFRDDDVAWQLEFLDSIKDHPVGDFHGFMGFDTLRDLEKAYLPAGELVAKYDGSVGYQPPGKG